MPETLASITTKTATVIQDVSSFLSSAADGEIEQAIREALERYSNDAPREIVADIAGDGSTYDLTLPATYIDGASRIVSVEYPAGERTPLYVDANEWTIYRTSSTTKLRLVSSTPGTGQTVRVVFTAMHTLKDLDSATATTIPARHTYAVVNLAAAHCLFMLANRFLHEQESTLNADSVNRSSKSDEARRIGGALIRRYQEAIGAQSGERPALAVRDWDAAVYGGIGALTHRGRAV
jgi:hypothetical protein